jgi:type IV pilus assembly protein PilM
MRIRRAIHVSLPEAINVRDPASMGDFIRRTLGEHRIRTRRVVVDIPRQDVVLNMLSLPESTIDELASMVHIQMAKDLPFSKDEAVIDFALTQQEGTSATRNLWVAAARNMVLDHYKRVVASAGLKLERIGLRPFANQMAVVASQAATGRIMIVDIGPAMTEINVIRDGNLVYSRAASVAISPEGFDDKSRGSTPPVMAVSEEDHGIPLEDDNVTRPEPMEILLIEVNRTIQAYRATEPGAHLDRVVLTGSVTINQKVCDAFEDRFNTLTQIYEIPQSLRWMKIKDESTAAYCSVIGLALSSGLEGTLRFDFLHPKEPEAQRRERAKRMPMIAATVALFVATAGMLLYNPIRKQNARIEELKAHIKQLNEDEETRTEFMKQLNDVRAWKKSNVPWLDPLEKLADKFPSNKEAYITRLEIDDKGSIEIDFYAANKNVGTKVVKTIAQIKDDKGREIFVAEPGTTKENKRDPKYRIDDKVVVQIKSLLPEEKSKKKKRKR